MRTPGDDWIDGTSEGDQLGGGAGNDTLYGLEGDDTIGGEDGDDLIFTGSGYDIASGDDGNDTIINGGGDDIMHGGHGDDLLILGDYINGSDGRGYGGSGNDTIVVTATKTALIMGGPGIDTLVLDWANLPDGEDVSFVVSPIGNTASSTSGYVLAQMQIERVILTSGGGNDAMGGGEYGDIITVGLGRNQVYAGLGDDMVSYVISDSNTLYGGGGDDLLLAQSDTEPLYFIVNNANGRVDDGNLSSISDFERYGVRGGTQADIASLGAGNDTFRGGGGNDTGFGAGGDDLLMGITGNDVLYGGTGNDTMYGGVARDSLFGDDGNDVLHGGHGHDTLTGGARADVFAFRFGDNGFDLITDFTSGEDHIRYSADLLGVFSPGPGPLDPTELQIGGSATTPGVFVLTYDAGTDLSTLLWSDNGHGAFSLMKFSGNVSMVASDIILF